MNAIDILTREKLDRQYWLSKFAHIVCGSQCVEAEGKRVKQELTNIERALETLKAEARRKAGVE